MSTSRGWQKTDYNPNILRHMDQRSADIFAAEYAPYEERFHANAPKPAIEFARQFDAGYHKALDALNKADPKGRVLRAFKVPPIAPKLTLIHSETRAADVLTGSKFGGVPDLRGLLAFLVSHNKYMVRSEGATERSATEILRGLWPVGPDGEPMMFVGQVVIPSFISLPWDYFSRELVCEPRSYSAPFSEYGPERDVVGYTRTFCFFRSAYAPFFDPRLDCGYIQSTELDGKGLFRDEEPLTEAEYLSVLAEALPQACRTHHDDRAVRWDKESHEIVEMNLGFDLDIISDYGWYDAPKMDTWKIEDAWREAYVEEELYGPQLFGAPSSQQTQKRFIDPNSYRYPQMMRPWLSWSDEHDDFTWQLCFCKNPGQSGFVTWGKTDGSCT